MAYNETPTKGIAMNEKIEKAKAFAGRHKVKLVIAATALPLIALNTYNATSAREWRELYKNSQNETIDE